MTRVALHLDGSTAGPTDVLARLPRRVRLSRAAVEDLAARTATPLPWADQPAPAGADRLGTPAPAQPVPAEPADTGAELREARLVTALGDVHPEVLTAMGVFGAPEVVLDLDLSVRRSSAPRGYAQAHSWQRLREGRVTTMSTAGGEVELGWLADDLWQVELARAVTVTVPRSTARPPERVVDLPHELLLGTGEALRVHREDVFDELVARHTGSVRVDDGDQPLGRAGTADQLRLLHGSALGRMHTVVSGVGAHGDRKVGWLSWLLFPDGWRALTPHTTGGEPRVRLHPVRPLHLGVEVSRLATVVRA